MNRLPEKEEERSWSNIRKPFVLYPIQCGRRFGIGHALEEVSESRNWSEPQIREIDLTSLPYVPLPRAPSYWEERQTRAHTVEIEKIEDHFEILDTDEWFLSEVEKLPMQERPDPAFRKIHPTDSGISFIDDLGNAKGYEAADAAVLHYGRSGEVVAEKGLLHGTYRIGVNPLGRGLIAMSKDCVLHAYDDHLNMILETPLREASQIKAAQRRLQIGDNELKNHIRCVGLSRNNECFLFTIVDEAWCVDLKGRGLWGARFPMQEGWRRVSSPSETYGTSREIQDSLNLMDLSFPLTPDQIKKRYRKLAKQWHPDLHPGDSHAEEKMKALTCAAEILTGMDVSSCSGFGADRFVRNISHSAIEVGGVTMSWGLHMEVSEKQAADWIYAANFAGHTDSVFLAGYSGRVVMLNETGEPVRAYDIGAVPRRIVDTDEYLYILTDTRLYILKGEALHSIVDVYDAGELVVAQTGFGLLEKKQFRWFRKDGDYLGGILTKDPIRRVYSGQDRMVVETRQRRVIVKGGPTWWEE